ncbi:MAG: DUF2283 domain-containing protein [Candidatus Woesearchaeota archaeon]
MLRKFKFDYDKENDSLFLYDPKVKSNASVEIDDLIIDFSSKKEISGIEILNTSKFMKELDCEINLDKEMLQSLTECKVDFVSKQNWLLMKLMFVFKSQQRFCTTLPIPTIREQSPAIIQ